MAFKKGQSGNPVGKPKGALNKTTKEIREVITAIVGNNIERIQEDMDQLTPKERISVMVDLMQFVTPKLKAVGYHEIVETPDGPDLSAFTTEELRGYLDKMCD